MSYPSPVENIFNHLILMSDWDRISPYSINQTGDENKGKILFGCNQLIQY